MPAPAPFQETPPLLKALTRALESVPELRLALVYGSLAANRLAPSSDVDIAVAADGPLSWESRMMITSLAAEAARREVDLLDLRVSHGLILREALSRGRLLFCRDRNLYASLISRMWGEQEDYQPLVNRINRDRVERWIGK